MTRRWQREMDNAEATRIAEEEQIARVAAYLAAREAETAAWNAFVAGQRRLTLRGVQRDLQQAFRVGRGAVRDPAQEPRGGPIDGQALYPRREQDPCRR
jgi:hypothetical protein